MPDSSSPAVSCATTPVGAQPLAWAGPLVAWVLGTALQLNQPTLNPLLFYCAVAVWSLALGLHTRGCWRWGAVLALAFSVTGARAAWFAAHALTPALEGQDLVVHGVVSGLPQVNESGQRFVLEVESAYLDGQATRLPPRIAVAWYQAWPGSVRDAGAASQATPQPVQAGQRWRLPLRLKVVHGVRNPGGFDFELWMWEQGLQASASIRSGASAPEPELLGPTGTYPLALARQKLRERIRQQLPPGPATTLVTALVTGDQQAIGQDDWDLFRATGVSHLVSISGLHITLFAWLAAALLGALWRRSAWLCRFWPAPQAALLGGVLLAWVYAVLSGWGVPAQRTCCMLLAVVLLRLGGWRWPWPMVWLGTAVAVLLGDPWALMQPGFWLSFVAVAVLFAHGPQALGSATWAQRILGLLREQWLVSLALAPLSLLLFGQLSLVGLVANLLAIPWVTWVITPLCLGGCVLPGLWWLASAAIDVWLVVLQCLGHWPLASLQLPPPPLGLAVPGLLGTWLLVLRLPWGLRVLGLPLALPMLVWRAPAPPVGGFELLGADVGQGNAVLVRTATHLLLYDAGPRYSLDSDAGHRVLVPLLQRIGQPLDRLVLSHRDSDHTGGGAAVLAQQPQAELYSSLELTHPLLRQRPGTRCMAGQQWEWDGVVFAFLHPRDTDYLTSAKPNAVSCVLLVRANGQSALLAGDIERAQEAALIARDAPLAAQWLLVPHHGSKGASSAGFIQAVQPQWALVQAGYRNRFGHPGAPVLARYAAAQTTVLDSPHCGAMTWRSWEPAQVHCERVDGKRYWQHLVP